MAKPIIIQVKESKDEIKKILKASIPFIQPRVRMLLLIKENEATGISKIDLANALMVSPTSIRIWRQLYINGGLKSLIKHNKTGFKPSLLTKEEESKIEAKLNDASNGLRGYKELVIWINDEFNKDLKYNTILKFCVRKFKSKSKVARKSHIKKDNEAVEAFKKTSVKNAKNSTIPRKTNTRK
jgi:transposase